MNFLEREKEKIGEINKLKYEDVSVNLKRLERVMVINKQEQ